MINTRIATREEQLRVRQIKEKEREEARAAEGTLFLSKTAPDEGLEPSTVGLKVQRSTD